MASKSEQRERLRQERLAAERRAAAGGRGRMIVGYLVAGVISVAVLIGLVIVLTSGDPATDEQGNRVDAPELAFISQESGFDHGYEGDGREGTPPGDLEQGDLETAADEAGCELELDLKDEGNTHLSPGQDPPDYATVPANSGNHNPEQQADGAYLDEVEPQYYVHSMEHGRITIEYSPELTEEDQLAIKGVFEEDSSGIVMFPNSDLDPGAVAMSGWTNLMQCPSFEGQATIDAVRDFRDEYRGAYNPESVPLAF
ncbi:DUF3105 domain-containing protein [Thermoleophilia bacterium SCSIO 60948]|nr:DUF3105 domain-containing protein [Thermoleophilia bacterium SCSIO 60948]